MRKYNLNLGLKLGLILYSINRFVTINCNLSYFHSTVILTLYFGSSTYIFVCECVFGNTCIFLCECVFGSTCIFLCECVFGSTCIFLCKCVFGNTCIFLCECVFGITCIFLCECVFDSTCILLLGWIVTLKFGNKNY